MAQNPTMDQLVTRCPNCATSFRITDEHLKSAGGSVRCGSCLSVFDAVEHQLFEDGPNTPQASEQPNFNGSKIESNDNFSDSFLHLDKKTNKESHDTNRDEHKPVNDGVDETWALDLLAELEAEDDDPNRPPSALEQVSEKHPPISADKEPALDDEDDTLLRDVHKEKLRGDDDDTLLRGQAYNELNQADEDSSHSPSFDLNDDEFDFPDNLIDLNEDKTAAEFEAMLSSDETEQPPILPMEDSVEEELLLDSSKNLTRAIQEELGLSPDTSATDNLTDRHALLSSIQPEPVQMHIDSNQSRSKKRLWYLLSTAAVLGLVMQYLAYNKDELARDESYRGTYALACRIIGCQLPIQYDLDKVRSNNLVIRTHPNLDNVLVVDTIIINEANFEQPFPNLKLAFSDINGRTVASRIFKPSQYLGGEMIGESQMPAQQPIQLSLEIVDPGANAVNYTLVFAKSAQINEQY